MIGSDHAGKMKKLTESEPENFNLGGDLAFILTNRIAEATRGIDVNPDEIFEVSKRIVSEAEFNDVISRLYVFRDGVSKKTAIETWAIYIAALHIINIEVIKNAAARPMPNPSADDVKAILSFIKQEKERDNGRYEAYLIELIEKTS